LENVKVIYNDLQAEVLSLLRRTDCTPEEALHALADEHQGEPDFYSRLMAALINIELAETDAQATFIELLEHHQKMEADIGRRTDLRVAAMDYLLVHPEVVPSPTIVDHNMLQLTQRLAAVDELTGLFNRRFLETYLAKELNRAQRYEQVFAVLFLDLDDFKLINDSLGHAVGDRVLAGLGKQITDMLRHEDFAARYGGEESTIVLPQTTIEGAVAFGERLRTALHEQEFVPDVAVTFSAGVAAYPRDGVSADEILRQADAALYDAKLTGKDRIVVSTTEKRATTRHRADFPAVAYAGNAEIGPLRLCDVSADGYSLVSDDMLRPGQMLRVRVYTEAGARHEEHEVLAHVVWSRRMANGGSYRAGGQWDPPHCAAAAEIVRSITARAAG
jgi:diguanylate cyclase (GGDEF)-like protein